MQTLTDQKSRTVCSWLLIGLNLRKIMWINQKRSHFWAPCCNVTMYFLLLWTYKSIEGGGKRGGGRGGRLDLPNPPLSLRESSLNHAQIYEGFYVTDFLTLKSASSRGMKVCTNSSGPILASRSWRQRECYLVRNKKQNAKICIKEII